MKIGILGGGNCYALNLANEAHRKFDVFGIGRSPQKPPAMWPVYKEYRYYEAHVVFHLQAVLAILDTERPDYIVNFAAQGEGQGSFGDKADLFYQTNTLALVRLAEELRKRSYLKRFIQVGTSELYGSVEAPSKETDPIHPTSPYAVSKAAFDLHLDILRRVHGFPATVVRPSNAYCRGQQLHRIIPRAIICALSGNRLPLQGGGRAQKTYIHATDLSRAILLLLTSEPGIYNCGAFTPTSIADVVRMCGEACGVDDFVDIVDDRVGQDGRYWLDSSKLRALGWAPTIDLPDGIADMVKWVQDYPELLTMDHEWRVRP
ncbi:MAG TPA: NAD-dependent epimerase/dehydratase family protein [Burkholderiales bacterium]